MSDLARWGLWPSGTGCELDGLVLHSGRLTLRPWQPGDAAAVQAVMADERMRRHLPLPWPYTAEDARRFVTDHAHSGRRSRHPAGLRHRRERRRPAGRQRHPAAAGRRQDRRRRDRLLGGRGGLGPGLCHRGHPHLGAVRLQQRPAADPDPVRGAAPRLRRGRAPGRLRLRGNKSGQPARRSATNVLDAAVFIRTAADPDHPSRRPGRCSIRSATASSPCARPARTTDDLLLTQANDDVVRRWGSRRRVRRLRAWARERAEPGRAGRLVERPGRAADLRRGHQPGRPHPRPATVQATGHSSHRSRGACRSSAGGASPPGR